METESQLEEREQAEETIESTDVPVTEPVSVESQLVENVPADALEAEGVVEESTATAEASSVIPAAEPTPDYGDEFRLQIATLREEAAALQKQLEELKVQLSSQKEGEMKRFKSLSGSVELLKRENGTLKRAGMVLLLVALVGWIL